MKKRYEEENEEIIEKMGAALENVLSSAFNDYVSGNAEFRAKAGLKTYIIREELSTCCKWCHDLAGKYEYGSEPADVYRRHDRCKCMVLFRNEKGKYQDVWSKKEYKKYNDARNEKIREITINDEEYKKIKRIAKDKGQPFIEVKSIWEKNRLINYSVKDRKSVIVDGVRYVDGENGAKVILDYSLKEKNTAVFISEKLGVNVEMIPRVLFPQGKRTPDYLINGMRFDKKEIKGTTHNTIGNIVGSLKKDGKIQAENIVLDMSTGTFSADEVLRHLEMVYKSTHYTYLHTAIVVDREEIVAILERI